MQYISLDDGCKLCLECLDSSIMDTWECQPLYHEIRDYYEGMNMRLDQQIPMLLVERQALNEAMEGEKDVSITVVLLLLFCFLISFIMPQGSNMCLVKTCFIFVCRDSIIFQILEDYAFQKNRQSTM